MSLGARPVVLMYHRVAEPAIDPWKLCVSPAHFREQVEALATWADVMPLRRLLDRSPAAGAGRPAVAVTFDDGYVDNLEAARPVLVHAGVPATVFVATGYLGGARQFWWDELAGLLLTPGTLPPTLTLGINGVTRRWTLGDAAVYREGDWQRDRAWRAPDDPPTARHVLFAELWWLLQHASRSRQEYLLNVLGGWAGVPLAGRAQDRAVTIEELRALGADALIEIGAHTVTHPILKGLAEGVQRAELRDSKAQLEALLDRPVESSCAGCRDGRVSVFRRIPSPRSLHVLVAARASPPQHAPDTRGCGRAAAAR
jgi:peptidoglycan/xylan/chitin deacetylase (PgdA/CDA1 family)